MEIVAQAAGKLSDNFTDAAFEFNKVMSGVSEQRPRWKRALGATEGMLSARLLDNYMLSNTSLSRQRITWWAW